MQFCQPPPPPIRMRAGGRKARKKRCHAILFSMQTSSLKQDGDAHEETNEERLRKERLDLYYRKEEEDLVKILSERHGLPYINLLGISITADALRLIPEK